MQNVKNEIADVPSNVSLTFWAIGDMSNVCQDTQVLLQQSGNILCDVPRTGEPVKIQAP